MDDYRRELAEINRICEQLGIERTVLNVSEVSAITGWSPKTVKRYIRFGGTTHRPMLTRSQLARQMYELSLYHIEGEPA